MFSQVCVKNSVHRGACVTGGPAWQVGCMAGGMHGIVMCMAGHGAGGHAWQGACMAGGVCMAGGMHGSGMCVAGGGMHGREAYMAGACMAGGACVAEKTAIAAGGTHPTGMYSCSTKFSSKLHENEQNWARGASKSCLCRSGTALKHKTKYITLRKSCSPLRITICFWPGDHGVNNEVIKETDEVVEKRMISADGVIDGVSRSVLPLHTARIEI